jgi:hypothetical protein
MRSGIALVRSNARVLADGPAQGERQKREAPPAFECRSTRGEPAKPARQSGTCETIGDPPRLATTKLQACACIWLRLAQPKRVNPVMRISRQRLAVGSVWGFLGANCGCMGFSIALSPSPSLIKARTERLAMTSLTRELIGAGAVLAQ